jgi:hypothetical protein
VKSLDLKIRDVVAKDSDSRQTKQSSFRQLVVDYAQQIYMGSSSSLSCYVSQLHDSCCLDISLSQTTGP